jgi:hypothetical protein
MRPQNQIASLLGHKYPGINIPFYQFGMMAKLLKLCQEWNLDVERLVNDMPDDVAQPFFYLKKVVENKIENERQRRVGKIVARREKQKIRYYNEEDF